MSKHMVSLALSALFLMVVFSYADKAAADSSVIGASAPRTVLYLTYPANSERRCAGKERVGYRANPECCPEGFSLAGVRVNGQDADAVCVQDEARR